MSTGRRFPFGGVPVYNPHSLSKDETIAQFYARQGDYQGLLDLLREERPPHVLIIGARGMGKTTLLQRLRYGVEDDLELQNRYLVLAFPEEQYNVHRLHRFFLNALDAVADALELLHDRRTLDRVNAFIEVTGKLSPEQVEEAVPKFLAEIGQEMRRSLLMLVDNADRLIDTIPDGDQWKLRELLASRPDLTMYGATTQASDGVYQHDRAFFEFFKVHRLLPLTPKGVRELLLRLSESVGDEVEEGAAKRRVEDWLASDEARLRALVELTGGNPRTTVLLFHLVLDGLEGGAREYLERLLDQCTPGYKGRVDDLPAQAQQVLDAVAIRWDPVTAQEVAGETGLDTGTVSAQLTRLVRQGLLEKADPGDSKKALYQVSERFFNIWYLMRASRRVRTKLRWFVEFLRVFFEPEELEHMAWDRLERSRNTWRSRPSEIETVFAYALASGKDRGRFEDYLRCECPDMEAELRPYLEAMPWPEGDAVEAALKSIGGTEALRAAVRVRVHDVLQRMRAGRDLVKSGEFVKAETAFRKVVEIAPEIAWAWSDLGLVLLVTPERREEAESAFRKAVKLAPKDAASWIGLGIVLSAVPERREEAEAAYRQAIELDPKFAPAWDCLGRLMTQSARIEGAEAAYRKAIELDPGLAAAWSDLGCLLGGTPERSHEAEAAFRKAVELDPRGAWCWAGLGAVLADRLGRVAEAEAALRSAIELDGKCVPFWHSLAVLLGRTLGRLDEAEAVFDKALELDPHNGQIWGAFAVFLACGARKPKRAEEAFHKSLELEPNNARTLRNLGVLLYCEMDREKEGVSDIRRAQELAPEDPVSAAVLAACAHGSNNDGGLLPVFMKASGQPGFWDELLGLCGTYAPFGKILIRICDLVLEQDDSNGLALLHRAVGVAQLGDFPRASVTLEDALTGDAIDRFATGRKALEVFFAAAVKNERVADCIELLDRKGWKDAWRPIYEALTAVEEGSGEYLKRVAVEIRGPALDILRRIAPELPGLPPVGS